MQLNIYKKIFLTNLVLQIALTSNLHAMEVKVSGNVLIMSGPVVGDEYEKVKNAFMTNPSIDLAILRNSHGGDAKTGYRVGELFRERGISTAVSGFCISSCSRMFLGGKRRLFTDDYPAQRTYIGFHGHYNNNKLNSQSVNALGLYDWILKYSDGKADEALVKRWINIESASGMVAFMHPDLALKQNYSTFFCEGTEQVRPLGCEPLKETNAIDRGIATETLRIASPDQNTLPEKLRAKEFPASGYAQLSDVSKVPLVTTMGIENYKKFLESNSPKAFAVSHSKQVWAWNSGNENANELALQRCADRAKETCFLYAVDELVVFKN